MMRILLTTNLTPSPSHILNSRAVKDAERVEAGVEGTAAYREFWAKQRRGAAANETEAERAAAAAADTDAMPETLKSKSL